MAKTSNASNATESSIGQDDIWFQLGQLIAANEAIMLEVQRLMEDDSQAHATISALSKMLDRSVDRVAVLLPGRLS